MADALKTAASEVEDPLLNRSLGELGMIRSVKRSGEVVVALPIPNYPLVEELNGRLAVAGASHIEYEIMDDQARATLMEAARRGAPPGIGEPGSRTRVVTVASGKGGVGKSSVTTNLAVSLVGKGHTVGVIDADIWGFSIPKMLGVTHQPVVVEQTIVPPTAHGVKAMSMDYFVGEDTAVIWRGPMLHKAIEQFLKEVWWDGPDFLLVDMPPGTGDVSISLSQFLPRAQVLLVTTPQPTAKRVARRASLMAQKVNHDVIGVIENMAWFTADDGKQYRIFGEGGGQALAEEIGVPLMAQIPLVLAMRSGADSGEPVSIAAPGSEAHAAFDVIADAVISSKPRVRTHQDLVIR